MNRNKLIFSVYAFFLFNLPLFASAQGAIVPCGKKGDRLCTLCDFYLLAKNIIDFILLVIIPVGVIALAIGGLFLLTSAGSEQQVSKGKKVIKNSIIGIIISFAAWLIINTIISVLVDPTTLPLPWNEFPSCPDRTDLSDDTSSISQSPPPPQPPPSTNHTPPEQHGSISIDMPNEIFPPVNGIAVIPFTITYDTKNISCTVGENITFESNTIAQKLNTPQNAKISDQLKWLRPTTVFADVIPQIFQKTPSQTNEETPSPIPSKKLLFLREK